MQLQGLPAGNRTRVLWITRPVLYQLSYRSRCRQLGREFSIYILMRSCIFRNWSRFGSYNVYLIDTIINSARFHLRGLSVADYIKYRSHLLSLTIYIYRFFPHYFPYYRSYNPPYQLSMWKETGQPSAMIRCSMQDPNP